MNVKKGLDNAFCCVLQFGLMLGKLVMSELDFMKKR